MILYRILYTEIFSLCKYNYFVGIFLLFIMNPEDSGRRMKEEMDKSTCVLTVSATVHVMFMRLYFYMKLL